MTENSKFQMLLYFITCRPCRYIGCKIRNVDLQNLNKKYLEFLLEEMKVYDIDEENFSRPDSDDACMLLSDLDVCKDLLE